MAKKKTKTVAIPLGHPVTVAVKPMTEIIEALTKAFRNHIGAKNGMTIIQMHNYVYNTRCSKLEFVFRCQKMMGAINHMKKHTQCFVVGSRGNTGHIWYVVKTTEEAKQYKNHCDSKIAGLQMMKLRCDRAVRNQYWKQVEKSAVPKQLK